MDTAGHEAEGQSVEERFEDDAGSVSMALATKSAFIEIDRTAYHVC